METKTMKRVLVTGVFDILHPGHIYLINKAAEMGDVIVIVAADVNSVKFKGVCPAIPEEQRLAVMKAVKNVKEVYIGQKNNGYLDFALSLNIDIIVLGPNQGIKEEFIREGLAKRNQQHIEVIRIPEMHEQFTLNSSSKIKQKIREM
jgi:FAD synthetase